MAISSSDWNPDSEIVTGIGQVVSANLTRANELFRDKKERTRTDDGQWLELVYCILAGTQVPVERARAAHDRLCVPENRARIALREVARNPEVALEWIQGELVAAGYRYPATKARAIVSAAQFFESEYEGRPSLFLQAAEPRELRIRLARDVSGVGIKIASHWLRNTGALVGTVDVHLRRFIESVVLHVDLADTGDHFPDGTFVLYERVLAEVADALDEPLPQVQFALWLYARERCSPGICSGCPLAGVCSRARPALF